MSLESAVLGSALAAAVMVTTAAIAGRFRPNPATHSAMQHLAAGLICAVVAGELAPSAMETGRPLELSIGFLAGLILMLSAKAIADRLNDDRNQSGMFIAVGLDVTIDGLLIGVAFALGTSTGGIFVLAFALEFVAVGLVIGAARAPRMSRAIGAAAIIAAPVIPAATVGELLLSPMSPPVEAGLMGFATSVCLYLVIEELMREAHSVREHPVANWLFFAGFLGLLLLQMRVKS